MEWADFYFGPSEGYRIEYCYRCQANDPSIQCMRDDPAGDGMCPIADKGPAITTSNQEALEIFRQAEGASVQVAAKNKTYMYIRPSEIESIMRMRGIHKEDQRTILQKVQLLEGIKNDKTPNRPA